MSSLPANLPAIRAVFSALFDAVETKGVWDEDAWEDLMRIVNHTGRLMFGWPHLESSESDIFGALDDIAAQLEGTKNAIVQTTTEARVVMHKLHKALDPEPEEAPLANPVQELTTEVPIERGSGEEPPAVPPRVEDAPSRVDRGAEEPVTVPMAEAPSLGIEPVQPNDQDVRLFVAVRSAPSISMAAAEREAGLTQGRGMQRLKLLDGYGTLPDDIKQWREARSRARGVPKGVSSLFMHQEGRRPAPTSIDEALSGESFEDRRKRLAREASERTWRQRHEVME